MLSFSHIFSETFVEELNIGELMSYRILCIALATSSLLAGCTPMTWSKTGASQNEFSLDRYTCTQESQQRVSGALVNASGGVSSSQVITNGNVFSSCMNAKGWYLGNNSQPSNQGGQPQESPLKTALDARTVEYKATCELQSLKAFFEKTPCLATTISLAQLSDSSRITSEEKAQLDIFQRRNTATTRQQMADYRQYGGQKGSNVAASREKYQAMVEKNQLDLYTGTITWGEYNRHRQELSNQISEEYNRIIRN